MKLDIGCGKNKTAGYVGIDIASIPEVDYVMNIDTLMLPCNDNTVDEIKCHHTLEHCVNIIHIMNEFYRVCKNDSMIDIVIPYGTTPRWVQDPTHKTCFNEFTFPKYLANNDYTKIFSDYGLKANFEIIDQYIMGKEFNKLDLYVKLKVIKDGTD